MERIEMLFRRLLVQLMADRRKFGLLCALAAVGLLFWARIIVIKNLPRAVMADGEQALLATADEPGKALSSDNQAQLSRTVVLEVVPGRDPFALNSMWFSGLEEDASLSNDQPKSALRTSEDPEQVISHLRLEAVMQGSPMAVISGRTYRPGDLIDSQDSGSIRFVLVEVQRRSVVLEHAGRRYELRMGGSGT